MPRMPGVEYAGAIYHVTVRMIGHASETGRALDRRACLFAARLEADPRLRRRLVDIEKELTC